MAKKQVWTTRRAAQFLLLAAPFAFAAGCDESYATIPARENLSTPAAEEAQVAAGADWDAVNDAGKKPMAQFPAAIAVARVQSQNGDGWQDRRTQICRPDVEDQQSIDALGKLPKVAGIAPIDPVLLPGGRVSSLDIRRAAASLHADMVLIYSLDTQSNVEDVAAPLSVASLGLAPDQAIRVDTIASCALFDTRNGYVYGACRATKREDALSTAWTNQSVIDSMTQQTESAAFKDMCSQIQTSLWPNVLKANTVAIEVQK